MESNNYNVDGWQETDKRLCKEYSFIPSSNQPYKLENKPLL